MLCFFNVPLMCGDESSDGSFPPLPDSPPIGMKYIDAKCGSSYMR